MLKFLTPKTRTNIQINRLSLVVNLVPLLLVSLLFFGSASVCFSQEGDVNYLDLTALMLRDGNLDRAMGALDQVDLEAEVNANLDRKEDDEDWFDVGRYWLLRATTHQRNSQPELARDAFNNAIEAGRTDASIFLSLAQINFSLQDYVAALEAIERAGADVERIASVYHLKAQANWLLEKHADALAVLDQANLIFPEDQSFSRRKVFFLVELGLFQDAAELGNKYLSSTAGKADDYIAIGNALRQSGQIDTALNFLEAALIKFPKNVTVKKVLAHTYIDAEKLHIAADIIYEAALLETELLPEASELYRRAGQVYRALAINSEIRDQSAKLKQRLALLIELNRYEQAGAMAVDLRRVGLLENEDIRYALAYALFKTGDFEAAESHLSRLTRTDLFRKAIEVRRAMADCEGEVWRCT